MCMSQYVDASAMTSKPYIVSGKYIERMSGGQYCARCCYKPDVKTERRPALSRRLIGTS